jgi:plastocyanin
VATKPQRQLGMGWDSRSLGFVGVAIVALLAAGATSLPSRAGEDVTVSQRNREFNPGRLAAKRGTVVHVVNDDRVTHHVFVDTPAMRFDSGEQPIGKIVDLYFDRSGSFPVRCAIHPTMHLEVVVD